MRIPQDRGIPSQGAPLTLRRVWFISVGWRPRRPAKPMPCLVRDCRGGYQPPAKAAPRLQGRGLPRPRTQTVSPKGDLLSHCGESKQSRTRGLCPLRPPTKVSLRSMSAASSAEDTAAYSVTPPAAEVDLGFSAGCESKRPTKRKRICRGDLWSPVNPSVTASPCHLPLHKGGFKY